ncbi:regulator of chromosome condensation 1/beta-lactamase-inhibitor protein II, partial [Tribonema minus]
VFSGGTDTCAILNDSTVKCWGHGAWGQLGQGSLEDLLSPPRSVVNLGLGRTARAIAIGLEDTCTLLVDFTVKCWGKGDHGRLGQGSTTDLSSPPSSATNLGPGRKAKAIATGEEHTCALLDDATIKCWGGGAEGQLGQGNTTDLSSPPSSAINLGLGRTAKAIATGGYHTCALLDHSTVKCWGYGASGQLGLHSHDSLSSPANEAINLGLGRMAKAIATGTIFTCAILDDATVKCWGYGYYGQLGQGSTPDDVSSPPVSAINLGLGRTAKAIATGYNHTCALLDDSTVKCWGKGDFGQLGQGSTAHLSSPPVSAIHLGSNRTAKAIAAGAEHTCALLDDSTVKCWGFGFFSQLGQGSTANLGDQPTEMASLAAIII